MNTNPGIAELAQHYARIYTRSQLRTRLECNLYATERQRQHNAKVDAGKLGASALAELVAENAVLQQAIEISSN